MLRSRDQIGYGVLAGLLWMAATVLVLWDGSDGHIGEVGLFGFLTGMLAASVTVIAFLARRIHAVDVAFRVGRLAERLGDS